MDIKNVTQFYNFIVENELIGLHSTFQSISDCMISYKLLENCYNGENRAKVYNNCNQLYINAVQTAIVSPISIKLLAKTGDNSISFFHGDTNYIKTINR